MLINSIIARKGMVNSKRWGEDMIDLFSETFDPPLDYMYRSIVVDKEHAARPDLVSKILYGTTNYGDLICKLNGIANPFELNAGDVLVVPAFSEIDKFFCQSTTEDTIYDVIPKDSVIQNKPQYKKPKEKRKPNEAVIGDTRFKIDKTNRIIIY